MDAAACIGCGACVAACPNSAAQLFTSAKVWHLNSLPQGPAERYKRAEGMVETMEQFFGSCTNHGECTEACPKEIPQDFIAYMNRDSHEVEAGQPQACRAALTLSSSSGSHQQRSTSIDDDILGSRIFDSRVFDSRIFGEDGLEDGLIDLVGPAVIVKERSREAAEFIG